MEKGCRWYCGQSGHPGFSKPLPPRGGVATLDIEYRYEVPRGGEQRTGWDMTEGGKPIATRPSHIAAR